MTKSEMWRGTGGVYAIVNRVSGSRYYGSALCLGTRWQLHVSGLKEKRHRNVFLQAAWNKDGENAFEFVVLAVLERGEIRSTEQRLLNQFAGRDDCYNIALDASVPMAGRRHSEATRQKMSAKKVGRVIAWADKISAAKKGRPRTLGQLAADAEMRGKSRPSMYTRTPEQRKAQSERAKLWYAMATPAERGRVSRTGKKHSDATKAKMSATRLGKPRNAKKTLAS